VSSFRLILSKKKLDRAHQIRFGAYSLYAGQSTKNPLDLLAKLNP